MSVASPPLIQLRRLSKSYVGVRALHELSLDIAAGEVHAICGENGAGKSTLIKALTGVVTPDEGEILVAGRHLAVGSVAASEAAGIAVMHQESTTFPDLNAIDNIFVGREPTRCGGLLLDRRQMRRRAAEVIERLGERINPDVPLGRLSVAQRQMVAMARALSRDCRLLIMDEPTASLSARETEALLRLIGQLRRDGVTVLYVTHRLEEVFRIADRVTVLRDGQLVETRSVAETSTDQLIRLMVGREVDELARRHEHAGQIGDVLLQVTGLTSGRTFSDITFDVRAGEIVGLAGLVGAGRSELARAIFGIDRYDSGQVAVGGVELPCGSVTAAMAAGLALVPEDRQHEGLVLPMSVSANLSLPMIRSLRRGGLIDSRGETALVAEQMRALDVRAAAPQVAAETLSGGNQQKLVLGKWLATQPRVLLLDEPTRGIDVHAKAQVHRLIRQLAARQLATVVISSELAELLTICDRILVIREGRIAGELEGAKATQQRLLELALPDAQGGPDAEVAGG